ncbi:MAG: hypothetical protein ACX939_07450 [Hyphococcus sp.]
MPALAWAAIALIAGIVVVDEAGDAVEQVGDTATKDLLPLAAVSLALFVVLRK